jgi:Pyridoxamine 5'-phosphate oxidase
MTVTTPAREDHHRRTTLERTNMIWRDLEAAAPEVALLGMERFDRARVALLGTLRKDGSPRISPVEPYLTQGHLLFGAMSWSLKRRELLRDPRCVLHSTISDPDSGEGELKLYGRATEADEPLEPWVRVPSLPLKKGPSVALATRKSSLQLALATYVVWDGWSRRRCVTSRRVLGLGRVFLSITVSSGTAEAEACGC